MTKKNALVAHLIAMLNNGIIPDGGRLPSLRETAKERGVSIYTAISAYDELVELNIIENRPKAGYFATGAGKDLDAMLRRYGNVPIQDIERLFFRDEVYERYIRNTSRAGTCVQLSLDKPSPEFFLHEEAQETASHASRAEESSIGILKTLIARWMMRYSCFFVKHNISFFGSAFEALATAINSCRQSGKLLAIESPGNSRFRFCARTLHVDYAEIRSDPITGLEVSELERQIQAGTQFFAVLLQPSYSDPTGAAMPESKREKLVSLCAREHIPIIEYDVLGRPTSCISGAVPIKSMDHESVIYISDFSYSLGIPLSFSESGRYSYETTLLADFSEFSAIPELQIEKASGYLRGDMALVNTVGERYVQNSLLFESELRKRIPESINICGAGKGPYLSILLPEWIEPKAFYFRADAAGVYLAPGLLFSSLPMADHSFRVNTCASSSPEKIVAEAEALAIVIRDVFSKNEIAEYP